MLDSDKYAPQTEMQGSEDLVFQVRRLVEERVAALPLPLDGHIRTAQLVPGKMLRTRFAAWLAEYGLVTIGFRSLTCACAATEMAHTASLCHDDVIDGGLLRRHRSALWRVTSASAAVLIGDVLLGEAMEVLLDTEEGRYIR